MSVTYIPPAAAPSGIKSIQRGVIVMSALTGTATVAAVNVAKAELRVLGWDNSTQGVRIALTNSTTITATIVSSAGTTNVSWELTEWY